MKRFSFTSLFRYALLLLFVRLTLPVARAQRWTTRQANDWYKTQPFLVGANFIPSSAIIDRKPGYTDSIGMNII